MSSEAALRRVVAGLGGEEIVARLVDLAGADFTTLMLHVARERAGAVTPPLLLRRYRTDRFTAPATVGFRALRAAEDAVLDSLDPGVDVLTLSPLAPLGAHSAIATVAQHKIVTTMRGTEVAADPTNVLALEAALRRRARLAETAPVKLAAFQRVVRAQFVDGEATFAHFHLFGRVTAGRDTGSLGFERAAAADHVCAQVDALLAAGADGVDVELTLMTRDWAPIVDAVRDGLAARPSVRVVDAPGRESGRGYYHGFCFKTHARANGAVLELGDGGAVHWTRALVGSRKERCFISGIGLERLALLLKPSRAR